jgi:hypothetical protein
MTDILDGVVSIATGISIVLVLWGGVLTVGYALGTFLGDRGLRISHRLTVGAVAAVIGLALLVPATLAVNW